MMPFGSAQAPSTVAGAERKEACCTGLGPSFMQEASESAAARRARVVLIFMKVSCNSKRIVCHTIAENMARQPLESKAWRQGRGIYPKGVTKIPARPVRVF